jgi:hypothetical protein
LKASDPASALRTLVGCTPRTTAGRLAEALTLSAAAAIGAYADADTAAAKAEEAHRLALELGDPGAILDATWAHALAAHAKGELPARLRGYLRATSALPEIATRVFDGQLCVTERLLYGGMPTPRSSASPAAGHRGRAPRLPPVASPSRSRCAARPKCSRAAGSRRSHLRRGSPAARAHRRGGGEALSLLGRAHVAIARGDAGDARPHLVDALLLAREERGRASTPSTGSTAP